MDIEDTLEVVVMSLLKSCKTGTLVRASRGGLLKKVVQVYCSAIECIVYSFTLIFDVRYRELRVPIQALKVFFV